MKSLVVYSKGLLCISCATEKEISQNQHLEDKKETLDLFCPL